MQRSSGQLPGPSEDGYASCESSDSQGDEPALLEHRQERSTKKQTAALRRVETKLRHHASFATASEEQAEVSETDLGHTTSDADRISELTLEVQQLRQVAVDEVQGHQAERAALEERNSNLSREVERLQELVKEEAASGRQAELAALEERNSSLSKQLERLQAIAKEEGLAREEEERRRQEEEQGRLTELTRQHLQGLAREEEARRRQEEEQGRLTELNRQHLQELQHCKSRITELTQEVATLRTRSASENQGLEASRTELRAELERLRDVNAEGEVLRAELMNLKLAAREELAQREQQQWHLQELQAEVQRLRQAEAASIQGRGLAEEEAEKLRGREATLAEELARVQQAHARGESELMRELAEHKSAATAAATEEAAVEDLKRELARSRDAAAEAASERHAALSDEQQLAQEAAVEDLKRELAQSRDAAAEAVSERHAALSAEQRLAQEAAQHRDAAAEAQRERAAAVAATEQHHAEATTEVTSERHAAEERALQLASELEEVRAREAVTSEEFRRTLEQLWGTAADASASEERVRTLTAELEELRCTQALREADSHSQQQLEEHLRQEAAAAEERARALALELEELRGVQAREAALAEAQREWQQATQQQLEEQAERLKQEASPNSQADVASASGGVGAGLVEPSAPNAEELLQQHAAAMAASEERLQQAQRELQLADSSAQQKLEEQAERLGRETAAAEERVRALTLELEELRGVQAREATLAEELSQLKSAAAEAEQRHAAAMAASDESLLLAQKEWQQAQREWQQATQQQLEEQAERLKQEERARALASELEDLRCAQAREVAALAEELSQLKSAAAEAEQQHAAAMAASDERLLLAQKEWQQANSSALQCLEEQVAFLKKQAADAEDSAAGSAAALASANVRIAELTQELSHCRAAAEQSQQTQQDSAADTTAALASANARIAELTEELSHCRAAAEQSRQAPQAQQQNAEQDLSERNIACAEAQIAELRQQHAQQLDEERQGSRRLQLELEEARASRMMAVQQAAKLHESEEAYLHAREEIRKGESVPSTVPEAAALAIFGDLELGRSGSTLTELGLGDLQALHRIDNALQGLAVLMAWRSDLRMAIFGVWLLCHVIYMANIFYARFF